MSAAIFVGLMVLSKATNPLMEVDAEYAVLGFLLLVYCFLYDYATFKK